MTTQESIKGHKNPSILDLRRELGVVRMTGKYIVGFRQSYLSVLRGAAKAVILASNCPSSLRTMMEIAARASGVQVIYADIDSRELGKAVGKPFWVSTLSVIDPGNSSILGGQD
jgi:large subunit ribosomal protein L30e